MVDSKNQTRDPQNPPSNHVYTIGSTGGKVIIEKFATPFYGLQKNVSDFSPAPGEVRADYGVDPNNNSAQLVWINYRRLDSLGKNIADPAIVAGYISVKNIPLSSILSSDSVYRIGVNVNDVVNSLRARIKLCRELIKEAEDAQKIDFELKLHILEERLDLILKILEPAGVTHIILATGGRESRDKGGFSDRLDINLKFFNFFYPEQAFPIGDLSKGTARAVGRDRVVLALFPEGSPIYSTTSDGSGSKDPIGWKLAESSLEKFPDLRITFNQSPTDIRKQNSEKSKLIASKKWPTVEEVVNDNVKNLQAHPCGDEAEKARQQAHEWEFKFMSKLEHLKQRKGQEKFAKEYADALKKLFKAIKESLKGEQEILIEKIENTDPANNELFAVIKNASINYIKHYDIWSENADFDKEFEPIWEKTQRASHMQILRRIKKEIENMKKLPATKDALTEAAGEILVLTTDEDFLGSENLQKRAMAEVRPIAEIFSQKLDERYKMKPKLDDEMKALIQSYQRIADILKVDPNYPTNLLDDQKIKKYIDDLQAIWEKETEKDRYSDWLERRDPKKISSMEKIRKNIFCSQGKEIK